MNRELTPFSMHSYTTPFTLPAGACTVQAQEEVHLKFRGDNRVISFKVFPQRLGIVVFPNQLR